LQSLTIPSQDLDYGDPGKAFLPWPRRATDAILQRGPGQVLGEECGDLGGGVRGGEAGCVAHDRF
jgi:hypothetical protein